MKKTAFLLLCSIASLYAQASERARGDSPHSGARGDCPHPGRAASHLPLEGGMCLTTLFEASGSTGQAWQRYTAGYVHLGADFSMKAGEIVFAPAAGIVQGVYNNPSYGDENHIWIKYDDIPGYFVYGHLYAYVTNGQRIEKEGFLGEISKNKTMAPHLHLGINTQGMVSGWGRAKIGTGYQNKGFENPLKPVYMPYLPKPN